MRRRAPEPFRAGGAPTRTPGDRRIQLAPAAGDLHLGVPHLPGTQRPPRRRPARVERIRGEVGEPVPFSGIYNVVDADGRYLQHQIACHRDTTFPPTSETVTHGRPYRYELEAPAVHLHAGEVAERPRDLVVHRPREVVPRSGVYAVVDERGDDLGHQHALVEGRRFPADPEDPRAYGYVLEYEARHLSDDLRGGR
jgi:hypothetical protein